MKTESKTSQQTNAYFLFQEWIATEMNAQGVSLSGLVTQIQPRPTKTSLHEIFKAILLSMYGKDSTRGISREELNECLEVYMDALAMIGVHLPFPDASKKALLDYYS